MAWYERRSKRKSKRKRENEKMRKREKEKKEKKTLEMASVGPQRITGKYYGVYLPS